MALTLTDILKLPALQQAKVVVAGDGQSKVEHIMVMEAMDVENWAQPHELLLSSFFALSSCTALEVREFVLKVKALGCAGLIFKVDRFVSQLPAELVETCQETNLPLIQIDVQTKYRTIIYQVMQALFNETNLLLNRYRKINQMFITLSQEGSSVVKILELLAALIENPVELFQQDQQEIYLLEDYHQRKTILSAKKRVTKKEFMNYDYFRHTLLDQTNIPVTQLFVEIPRMNQSPVYLGITEQHQTLDSDYMAIENAVNFLQLEFVKQLAIREIEGRYKVDLIDDLITGRVDNQEKMQKIARELGLDLSSEYRFVVIQFFKDTTVTLSAAQNQYLVQLIRQDFPAVIYRIKPDRILFLMPQRHFQQLNQFKAKLALLLKQFVHRESLNYRVGISQNGLADQFQYHSIQAFKVISIASQIFEDSFLFEYHDLGIYRFLVDIKEDQELASFIPESLQALTTEKGELLETLEAYLAQNKNGNKTAEKLFIHPKTLHYRLKKIREITGIDLEDNEEILQITIGLHVLKILKMRQNK